MTTMDEHGTIRYTAGDTFELHFIDIMEDNVIIDWTGWKHEIKISKQIGAPPMFVIKESDIDLSTPGLLRIKKQDGVNLQPGLYYYDWVVTRPDGSVETWFNNKIFLVD